MKDRNRREISVEECRERGFTLIEILIVIAIVGIMTASAIGVYYISYLRKARITEPLQTLDAIKMAISAYYQRHQSFSQANGAAEIKNIYGISIVEEPNRWAYIVDNSGAVTATAGANVGSGLNGGWIKITPTANSYTGIITWNLTADGMIVKNADIGL